MNRSKRLILTRQRKLGFERIDTWQKLPAAYRTRCRELVAQLLLAVVRSKPEGRSKNDERED